MEQRFTLSVHGTALLKNHAYLYIDIVVKLHRLAKCIYVLHQVWKLPHVPQPVKEAMFLGLWGALRLGFLSGKLTRHHGRLCVCGVRPVHSASRDGVCDAIQSGVSGLRRNMDVTSAGIEQTADLTSRRGFLTVSLLP